MCRDHTLLNFQAWHDSASSGGGSRIYSSPMGRRGHANWRGRDQRVGTPPIFAPPVSVTVCAQAPPSCWPSPEPFDVFPHLAGKKEAIWNHLYYGTSLEAKT